MKPSALVVDLKEPLLAPTRDKRRECRARGVRCAACRWGLGRLPRDRRDRRAACVLVLLAGRSGSSPLPGLPAVGIMRGCQWHTASAVQCEYRQATYTPPPTIPYTFLGPLGPLVGAVSGMTTSEAQRPHPGRMRRLRAGGVVGISASAAPVGMPLQT